MKKFKISIINHYTLEYREIRLRILIEIDFREPYIEFSKDMISRWEPPFHNLVINDYDRERIYNNVKKFLKDNFYSKELIFDE